ncbi:hypothetical protein [Piscinibacter koreensis]|uniref:OmpA-like domain-containing protein n=1 Tax=Piscinibacter koreensis TaxID=2742824 RepID=A0A7Y6NNU8_9BURK|nr:hypothetical protein [Schlegelella koreensis]NUZ06549.1 hypothetical protein [Schlegelella koreensis]
MRLTRFALPAAALALLAACQTTPAPRAAEPPPAQPDTLLAVPPPAVEAPRAPVESALAIEQRRLADLFRGTPVVFQMQPDGALRIDVPLRHSFATGSAVVRPALGAVLDRVAASQRDRASTLTVTAPRDEADKTPRLASSRTVSIRSYLVGRGLTIPRVIAKPDPLVNTVTLVVRDPAPL